MRDDDTKRHAAHDSLLFTTRRHFPVPRLGSAQSPLDEFVSRVRPCLSLTERFNSLSNRIQTINMEDLEPIRVAEQSSFCVELLRRLNMQRGETYLCDITLVAKEGTEFRAHKNVLSAVSPFFVKLLKTDMKEKEEGVIRFEEMSESILADVLDFIYTGSIKMKDKETAKELIFAAEYLLLLSLKTRAGRFLEKQLTSTNCISTLRFAQKYRCDELVDKCTKFIHDNFASVAESDEFLKLEAEEVEKWISSENICVPDEEDVFRIILKWIEQDKGERKAEFERLFRHIRLASLSRDYLLNVVTNELVVENVSCSRQVVDAIKLVITASEDTLVQSARRIETHAIVVRGGNRSYCYLPEKETWKLLAGGFSEDRNHTTQLIRCRNQVYSFPNAFYADTERYDPAFDSWAKIKLSPGGDDWSFAVLGGKIYVICRPDRRSSPVIKRYDEELCAWQTVRSSPDVPYSRNYSCVVTSGNCLYVLGCGYFGKAGRYDTVTSKWEKIASMQVIESSPFGVASQGKIFVTGLVKSSRSACEVYNVAINEWHTIASLNTRRVSGSMVCVNGTLYVLGGLNDISSKPVLAVESYDPKVNKWIQRTSIPRYSSSEEEKHSFQACTIKFSKGVLGKLYSIH